MANSTHKRGDTFDRSGQVTVMQNGVRLLDLTGWTGASQVRDKHGQLLSQLSFEWLDASQSLVRLSSVGSTEDWVVGDAKMDIQLTSSTGIIVSTATATIGVVEDITRA